MIHEGLIKYVISVVPVSDTPRDAASRYSVFNRNILDIATKLESVQEEPGLCSTIYIVCTVM